LECELTPGEYIALIDIQWEPEMVMIGEPFNSYVFSTYAETE